MSRPPDPGATFAAAVRLGVSGSAGKLLCLLAAYSDAGECWPSVRELSRRLKLSPPRIDSTLRELIERGLIHVDRRAGMDERNVYELRLDEEKIGDRSIRDR